MADISKINGYNVKDAEARSDIAGMKDGTITVGKASSAITATTATHALHSSSANSATTASNYTASTGTIATKFNEIDSSISDINTDVSTLNTTVESLVANKTGGYVFDSYAQMLTSLTTLAGLIDGGTAGEETINKYKVGDMLFTKAEDEPDYWVTGIDEVSFTTTVSGAEDTREGKTLIAGYWKITEIETSIDLSSYPTNTQTVSSITGVSAWDTDAITYKKANNTTATFLDHKTEISVEGTGGLSVASSDSGATRTYTIGQLAATSSNNGYMTKEQAAKLAGITESADAVSIANAATSGTKVADLTINGTKTTLYAPNGYTLPVATTTVRGGVKVSYVYDTAITAADLTTTSGRYYAVVRDSAEKLYVNVPWEKYVAATQSANGLMSAADKTKLDHIAISVSGEEMTITLA